MNSRENKNRKQIGKRRSKLKSQWNRVIVEKCIVNTKNVAGI